VALLLTLLCTPKGCVQHRRTGTLKDCVTLFHDARMGEPKRKERAACGPGHFSGLALGLQATLSAGRREPKTESEHAGGKSM
jgi:hypothetical protein